MRLFSISTLLSIAGAVAAGALLFWTSQSVQREESRLASLNKSVANENQSIRVLRAEWDYLNRPDRLEILATEYLGMSSSAAAFTVRNDVSSLPEIVVPAIPMRKPVMAPQPAVMQFEAPGAPMPSEPPRPKKQDGETFRQLLENLNTEGGAQ